MFLQEKKNTRQIVSLTPLIDIVFILLVFFMLASSFMEWQYIELSTAESIAVNTSRDNFSTVYIGVNKQYELNGKRLSLNEITDAIKNTLRKDLTHTVLIQPHNAVLLEEIVLVMEWISTKAGTEVSIIRGPQEG